VNVANEKNWGFFDIESEIAHFRDPMSHAFLNTFLAPPPHTIMGFLGSCCGFSESETEQKITPDIKVGCKVISLNGYLKDLAIMENQKDKNKRKQFPRKRKLLVKPIYRIYVVMISNGLDKKSSL
jgi:CRISPR-associated protein Cas5 subtype I-B